MSPQRRVNITRDAQLFKLNIQTLKLLLDVSPDTLKKKTIKLPSNEAPRKIAPATILLKMDKQEAPKSPSTHDVFYSFLVNRYMLKETALNN